MFLLVFQWISIVLTCQSISLIRLKGIHVRMCRQFSAYHVIVTLETLFIRNLVLFCYRSCLKAHGVEATQGTLLWMIYSSGKVPVRRMASSRSRCTWLIRIFIFQFFLGLTNLVNSRQENYKLRKQEQQQKRNKEMINYQKIKIRGKSGEK